MFRYIDTSKQRHRLRQKISKEKADLAKVLDEYNQLPTTACPVEIADALANKFPWALTDENESKFLVLLHLRRIYFCKFKNLRSTFHGTFWEKLLSIVGGWKIMLSIPLNRYANCRLVFSY